MKVIKLMMMIFGLWAFSLVGVQGSCTAGGPGSTSCSITISGGATIAGVGGEGEVTLSVSCGSGYHSCCNATSASCIAN